MAKPGKNAEKGGMGTEKKSGEKGTRLTERERVLVDIRKFEESVKEVREDEEGKEAVRAAKKYYSDAKYFLEKGEVFTAFGSIVYAHGLLDSVIKYRD